MYKKPEYPGSSIRHLKDIVKSLEKFSNENIEVENEVNSFGSDVNYYVEELIDYIQKSDDYHDHIHRSLGQTIDLISTDLDTSPEVVHFDTFVVCAYDAGLELYGVDRIKETENGVIHQFSYFVKDKNKFALFALKQ
jgi:hypothetical protein